MLRTSVTRKCAVFESMNAFVMVCRCLMCSESIFAGCSGDAVLGAWCFVSQHPPNTKRGMGGMNTFFTSFISSRTGRRPRICPTSVSSGDGTTSPIMCHPPPSPPLPPDFTASARVSSSCLYFTLVLPNKSAIRKLPACMRTPSSIFLSDSVLRLFRCQLCCVRSVTVSPLAVRNGITRFM